MINGPPAAITTASEAEIDISAQNGFLPTRSSSGDTAPGISAVARTPHLQNSYVVSASAHVTRSGSALDHSRKVLPSVAVKIKITFQISKRIRKSVIVTGLSTDTSILIPKCAKVLIS